MCAGKHLVVTVQSYKMHTSRCGPSVQVNHSPSFSTDTPLDLAIKTQLMVETLALVRVDAKQLRRGKAADKQLAAERLLRAKGRATADQPSAVSPDEMQSIRSAACTRMLPKFMTCSISYIAGFRSVAYLISWVAT